MTADTELMSDAEVIQHQSNQLKKLRTQLTDAQYMLLAYKNMLGPNGLAVANGWEAKGVIRTHVSWGPDAAALTGEERAKVLLDSPIGVPYEPNDSDWET